MIARWQVAASLCVCCATVLPSTTAIAQKQLRDPFEHPRAGNTAPLADTDRDVDATTTATSVRNDAGANPSATAMKTAVEFRPELRAIVLDGPRSLVNLGGRIIGVGESAGGYRLHSVEERDALFIKDGAQIRLFLDKEKK